jgi:hypothetical protein
MSCSLVEGTYCLHLVDTMKMVAAGSSETVASSNRLHVSHVRSPYLVCYRTVQNIA